MPKAKLDNAYEILLDYGYIEPGVSDREYWEALKQATLDFAEDGNVKYFDIVRAEEKEIRKKVVPRVKKKKITGAAFKKGTATGAAENIGKKVQADTTGASALTIRNIGPTPTDITPVDDQQDVESQSSPFSNIGSHLKVISKTVDSIAETLKLQFKEQKDTKEDARVLREQKDSEKQEKNLEKSGLGKGIKETAKKVFKPFMSIWDRFVNFLTTILFGKVIIKILDWFGNPANADRVKSFIRFLKDWWPTILASIIAFMPWVLGPAGLVVGIVVLLAWAIPKIIKSVKWLMGLPEQIGKFLTGGGKDLDKLEKESLKTIDKETEIPDISSEKPPVEIDKKQPSSTTPPPTSQAMAEGGPVKKRKDKEKDKEESEGGEVKGKKGKDKVPAMLTEGEFVMSKGAVQEYGAEILAGMNAAAGGTNKPKVQKGKSESAGGGLVGGGTGKSGSVVKYAGGGLVGGTDTLTETGTTGASGTPGSSGTPGASGTPGSLGSDGTSGTDGESGKDGKKGKGILGNIWGKATQVFSPQIRIIQKLVGGIKNIVEGNVKNIGGKYFQKRHLKFHASLDGGLMDSSNGMRGVVNKGEEILSGSSNQVTSDKAGSSKAFSGFISKVSKIPIAGPILGSASIELISGVQDLIVQEHNRLHETQVASTDGSDGSDGTPGTLGIPGKDGTSLKISKNNLKTSLIDPPSKPGVKVLTVGKDGQSSPLHTHPPFEPSNETPDFSVVHPGRKTAKQKTLGLAA